MGARKTTKIHSGNVKRENDNRKQQSTELFDLRLIAGIAYLGIEQDFEDQNHARHLMNVIHCRTEKCPNHETRNGQVALATSKSPRQNNTRDGRQVEARCDVEPREVLAMLRAVVASPRTLTDSGRASNEFKHEFKQRFV